MLVFGERGKPENSGKNLLVQSREPTNKLNPLESPLESRVVSKDKRVGKIRTLTRNSEYTRKGGSGEILSAHLFFPLLYPERNQRLLIVQIFVSNLAEKLLVLANDITKLSQPVV